MIGQSDKKHRKNKKAERNISQTRVRIEAK